MVLASFNSQILFDRTNAFNVDTLAGGTVILDESGNSTRVSRTDPQSVEAIP